MFYLIFKKDFEGEFKKYVCCYVIFNLKKNIYKYLNLNK